MRTFTGVKTRKYVWTMEGYPPIEVRAPTPGQARIAAYAVIDERFRLGMLTDRTHTAYGTIINNERPQTLVA